MDLFQGRLRVPPELVEDIIDNLHDDKLTLASLSLTSSIFLPSCRRHLFRTIHIRQGDREDFSAFEHFLESVPSICHHVRKLCLSGLSQETKALLRWRLLASVLARLRRLTTLEIVSVRLLDDRNPRFPQRAGPFELDQLVMAHVENIIPWQPVDTYDYYDIFGFLGLFSAVGHLELSWNDDRVAPEDVEEDLLYLAIPSQLEVRSILLGGRDTHPLVIAVLAQTPSVHSLRSIGFQPVCRHSVTYLAEPISSFRSVHTLAIAASTLIMPDEDDNGTITYDSSYWEPCLWSCTSLRSILIKVFREMLNDNDDGWLEVLVFLARAPRSLTNITFIFAEFALNPARRVIDFSMQYWTWDLVKEVLDAFPLLELVTFDFTDVCTEPHDPTSIIATELGEIAEGGRLRIMPPKSTSHLLEGVAARRKADETYGGMLRYHAVASCDWCKQDWAPDPLISSSPPDLDEPMLVDS